ncbi:MAG: carbohydrate-binding protein CenC, partial [Opitutaceae bacterium]|nr:carbohydrate-binding protein CenC [Opitutaceae bacterium]
MFTSSLARRLSYKRRYQHQRWLRTPRPPVRIAISCIAALTALIALSTLAAPRLAGEPAPAPEAQITVDAAKITGPVNRLIFGHNIEAADPYGIFSDQHRPSNTGHGFWDPRTRTFVARAIAAAEAVNIGALRYPGGSLANNHDWRKTVGPLSGRPAFQFGVDEYIALCRRLGAEPVFTVSDYALPADEMPAHAAALVEYLNAPAIPAHPWAMKRAAWGNPEPYGVKWFELGNETSFGNHHSKHDLIPLRRYTPEQYVDYARDCAAAMRAIDPAIKIGVVTVPGDARNIDLEWNRVLFRDAVPFADFVVLHFYTPGISNNPPDTRAALQACLAVGDQLAARLAQYRAAIRAASGRDLPLALTEYNIGAIQDHPFPFRYSFAAGLFSTDFICLCLQPENGVMLANYWQLINGYWGAIRTAEGGFTERATYPLFRLLGQHTEKLLLATDVRTPRGTFPGFSGVNATLGDHPSPTRPLQNLTLPSPLLARPVKSGTCEITATDDGILTVRLNGLDKSSYPVLFKL